MSTMAIRSASLPRMRSEASTLCQTRAYARAVCNHEGNNLLVNFSEEGFGIGLGRTLPTAWDMAVTTVEDSDVTLKSKEKAGAN